MVRRHALSRLLVLGFALAVAAFVLLTATAAAAPVASFTTSPASPKVGDVVTFDASASHDDSGGPAAGYRWSFGDGDTQTTVAATTTHIFRKAGAFTAVLVVVDAAGNTSPSATQTVTVSSRSSGPKAKFKASPKHPSAGQVVTLDASGSTDEGASITSYVWSFGDGATQTTTGPVTTHVYAAGGKFPVTLTIADSAGGVSPAAKHTINVRGPSPYRVPGTPTAHFVFHPARPSAGEPVVFDASTSSGGGRSIKKYVWSYGDDHTQATRTPFANHVYGRPGTVKVQLVVVTGRKVSSAPATVSLTIAAGGRRHHRHPARVSRLSRLRLHVCTHRSRGCPRRGVRVVFRLTRLDAVVLTISRRSHGHRQLKRIVIIGRRGRNTSLVAFKGARRGRYVLTATPTGGRTRSAKFVWRHRR